MRFSARNMHDRPRGGRNAVLLAGALVLLGGWIVAPLCRAADDPPAADAAAEEPAKADVPDEPAEAKAATEPAEAKVLEGKVDQARRVGNLLKITLPITGKTYNEVRQFVRRALDRGRDEGYRPVLIFEFDVASQQSKYGRGSKFGACSDLARYLTSSDLSAVQTVAYVPDSIQGHAVLAVMACDEIIMAPEAEIGSAGIDEKTIDPSLRSVYKEIAGRRKNFPTAVALAMLDPALEVLEVKTEFGTEYVSPDELQELREKKTVEGQPKVLIPAGQPGQFTGAEARQLRFVKYLASSPREVARALGMPPEAIEESATLRRDWVAIGVPIRGPIDSEKVRQAQKMIEDALLERGVDFVCLWIDSPGGAIEGVGGSAADSIQLANYVAGELKKAGVFTVAYIPSEARSDAALLALSCDEVVMFRRALLGGPGAYSFSRESILATVKAIRDREGPWRNRSWSLVAAIIDPDLEVYRYTRDGEEQYFCEEEAQEFAKEFPEGGPWVQRELITRPGAVLQVRGEKAEEYGLADALVDDFIGFRQRYGLEEDLHLAEPGWAEFFIDALASPAAAGLLLMIGFFALYAELHTPGIGIGGFLATVCFMIFFWSRFLGGTAGWLEALLFVAGVGCLMLEIFVLPGFGIFGVGGGLLVIASLILASQTFIVPRNPYQFEQFQHSLLILTGATVGVIASVMLARRWLPNAPVFNRMFLRPPEGAEAETIRRRESLVDFQALVGATGTTTTQLTPSGKARFGNELVDVIADGELIERGAEIVVVEVHGNRVLVRAAQEGD